MFNYRRINTQGSMFHGELPTAIAQAKAEGYEAAIDILWFAPDGQTVLESQVVAEYCPISGVTMIPFRCESCGESVIYRQDGKVYETRPFAPTEHTDGRCGVTDPRIVEARIERPVRLGSQARVFVKLENGGEILAVMFYDDEISIVPTELIGLTVDEAKQLKARKDRAYLSHR